MIFNFKTGDFRVPAVRFLGEYIFANSVFRSAAHPFRSLGKRCNQCPVSGRGTGALGGETDMYDTYIYNYIYYVCLLYVFISYIYIFAG